MKRTLVLLAGVMATPVLSAPTSEGREIVVTAGQLDEFADALQKCIEKKCNANQEIVAAVNYAEAQFRKGDYNASISTLDKTIGRTKSAASQYPNAVAALYEARSTLAQHDGDVEDISRFAFKSYGVQKHHGDPGNARLHVARLLLVDSLIDSRKIDFALAQIAAGREQAKADGRLDFVVALEVRSAILTAMRGDRRAALSDLQRLLARPEAQTGPARIPALATAVQLARKLKRNALADSLAAELASLGEGKLVQVESGTGYQPGDKGMQSTPFSSQPVNQPRPGDVTSVSWIDVGYTIGADGRAQDVEILEASSVHTKWAGPVLESIRTRKFAPPGETPGFNPDRRERYTLTADYVTPIGSMIRRRAGTPTIKMLDLTRDLPPASTN